VTAADVCPDCWHEGCDGNCKSAAERAAELRRQQVAAAAAQRRADSRRGGAR
jgi:hypothetical protein